MAADLERRKQVRRDEYYMRVAETVETGADCLGSNVGAVIVLENRIISTGYNGTPTGFGNCKQNGCVRCLDSWLFKQGRKDEMSDPTHVSGAALDRCICVHAEQNAIVTAARFGIRFRTQPSTRPRARALAVSRSHSRLAFPESCTRVGIQPSTTPFWKGSTGRWWGT